MNDSYQIESLMKNYTRELRARLSGDFPYIDVESENSGDKSLVGVRLPLIKPPEISTLHVNFTRGGEVWINGEFYLPPAEVGILGFDLKYLIPHHNNVGVHYAQLPYLNMHRLTAQLYALPFEIHTRKTLEYRIEDIKESIMGTVKTLRELQKRLDLVVDNAPFSLLLEYQKPLAQLSRTVGELVGQIPLYRLPLRVIEQQIKKGQLPQTLFLDPMKRRQLTEGKK